jgi:hypothetical protein
MRNVPFYADLRQKFYHFLPPNEVGVNKGEEFAKFFGLEISQNGIKTKRNN